MTTTAANLFSQTADDGLLLNVSHFAAYISLVLKTSSLQLL